MRKAETLHHWRGLEPGQPVKASPVPYRHKGSTYDQDGVRICGSREFIDSVLSNLKTLLDAENNRTRLGIVYKASTDRETGKELGGESWNCYVQVHERGREAQMVNALLSR